MFLIFLVLFSLFFHLASIPKEAERTGEAIKSRRVCKCFNRSGQIKGKHQSNKVIEKNQFPIMVKNGDSELT